MRKHAAYIVIHLTSIQKHVKLNVPFCECTKTTSPLGLHLPAQCHSFVTSVLSLRRFCSFTLSSKCGHSIFFQLCTHKVHYNETEVRFIHRNDISATHYLLPTQSRPKLRVTTLELKNLLVSLRVAKIVCLDRSVRSFLALKQSNDS